MELQIREHYGDQPISSWMAVKLRDYVKERYGLDIDVELSPLPIQSKKQNE